MNKLTLFISFVTLSSVVACSKGSSNDAGGAPNPPKPVTQDKLSTLEKRVVQFEQLLKEYKQCLLEKTEDQCSHLADGLNQFSF